MFEPWLSHTSTNTNFFPKLSSTFLTCFSRGERRKFVSTGSRTHNHQVTSPTSSPLSHPDGAVNFSLNIFILHRLRNKFLQLILISLDSASWELHQYSRRMCGPMKNPKVETRSRDSNLGPHICKADALPHDHGHR